MRIIGIVLMIVGIGIVSYFGFQHWSTMQSVSAIDESIVKTVDGENNSDLDTNLSVSTNSEELPLTNPFQTNQSSKTVDKTSDDQVATLVMPSIGLAFNVFMGTDPYTLSRGVGMYESQWTTSPDGGGHTVLSGHNDGVFRPVGDLKKGESIYIRYQGMDYEYKIDKIWITDQDDLSVIVEKDSPTLTVTTCYPFNFIGSAPDRYIIQGELVQTGNLLNL